jgi:hypothetical protein
MAILVFPELTERFPSKLFFVEISMQFDTYALMCSDGAVRCFSHCLCTLNLWYLEFRPRWMLWMLESSSDLSDVYFGPCCLIWDVWKTGERTRRWRR